MKVVIFVFLVTMIAMSLQAGKPYYDLNDAPALFEKFIKDYDRHYKNQADKDLHYQAFVESLESINSANAKYPDTVFDINNFADYTDEESQNMRGLLLPDDE